MANRHTRARWATIAAAPALVAMLTAMVSPPAFSDRLLRAHNHERASAGLAPLAWDPALQDDAQRWASELARSGRFDHAPVDANDPDPQGENLWAGTPGYFSPEAMVGYWIDEKTDYKPGLFPDNSRSGDWAKVGHYTQLMWRSTRSVGCALAEGPREEVLVCRYSEGGNVIGERPF